MLDTVTDPTSIYFAGTVFLLSLLAFHISLRFFRPTPVFLKSIDYIWYFGAAVSLVFAFLSYENRELERLLDFHKSSMYQSVDVFERELEDLIKLCELEENTVDSYSDYGIVINPLQRESQETFKTILTYPWIVTDPTFCPWARAMLRIVRSFKAETNISNEFLTTAIVSTELVLPAADFAKHEREIIKDWLDANNKAAKLAAFLEIFSKQNTEMSNKADSYFELFKSPFRN